MDHKAEVTKKSQSEQKRKAREQARKKQVKDRNSNHAAEQENKRKLSEEITKARVVNKEDRQKYVAHWLDKVRVARKEVLLARKRWMAAQFHRAKTGALSKRALAVSKKLVEEESEKSRKANKHFEQDAKRNRKILQDTIQANKRDQGRLLEENDKQRKRELRQREKDKRRKRAAEMVCHCYHYCYYYY